MSNYIRLDDGLILNLDKVECIVRKNGNHSHSVVLDNPNADLRITQQDYDAIRDHLFKFKPDYALAEGRSDGDVS